MSYPDAPVTADQVRSIRFVPQAAGVAVTVAGAGGGTGAFTTNVLVTEVAEPPGPVQVICCV